MLADDGRWRRDAATVRPHTITFTPVGETVACHPDETVLAALLRSGAKVLFGCRGGGCGTCKMRLVAGTVDHGRCSAAVLPEDEKAKGAFLSCQARPLGDVTVELTAANRFRRLAFAAVWGLRGSWPSIGDSAGVMR